ncbi:hypothetical protein CK203_081279 [Vitis vinifera]|uniref:Endonuclease/exonuclease/phosphatase domain-containing protein n=1 Tax=Vitis vinifera TaxID=29760 RepID=A0A438DAI7_VITVI|nr:hypothetical protein CK203_081279 [Vitis vinifera]
MPHAGKRVSALRSPMKIRLLSWNVRGANDSSKRKLIKALIRNQKVDLFSLQETKIHAMTDGVVRSLNTGRFLEWGTLDASGSVGGILISWDKRTLEVLDLEVGQYSVSCRFKNVEDGFVWMFTGVYGPFTIEERECLWEELGVIRGIWEDPWCLGGDFNIILFQRERSRQGRIINLGLDWTDFLVTQNWLDQFSGVLQSRLARPTSDHFPIFLEEEQDVREGVANAFHQLLSESSKWKADIEGLLKKVIGKVVSLDQNAFVMGRQIFDASLIANEVMQKMGFGSKWMGWMWRCISTTKFSVLTLFWFEVASSLRINLVKSEILPVGGVEEVEELAVELG